MAAVLASIAKSLWPTVEPLVLKAVGLVVADLVSAAKANTLPAKYAFLSPVIAGAEAELTKLFPVS